MNSEDIAMIEPVAQEPLCQYTGHVLVVDDDDRLRDLLSEYLTEQGFLVSVASSAAQAEDLLALMQFDAVILDVMMPGETGLSFMQRKGKDMGQTPVLMLTALGESDDRISGLEAGVADYMAKPFAPKELLLRLKNLMRHQIRAESATPDAGQIFAFGDYRFDLQQRMLHKNGEPIYLTMGEQECLTHFIAHAGTPISREKLAECLGDVNNTRSIDVLINRLRKKIEPTPARPVYLQTIRHAGYQLNGQML